jgi:hypothetical protein
MTTINGYSAKQITGMMVRWEKLIAFYNKRDNFQTETIGTEKEQKEYKSALATWDTLKAKRNALTA